MIGWLAEIYRERLTARGRYLLWTMAVLAALALDTRRTYVFLLFAVAAGLAITAAAFSMLPRPKVGIDCRLPARLTALAPVTVYARVSPEPGRSLSNVALSFPRSPGAGRAISLSPNPVFFSVARDTAGEAAIELRAPQRGRYVLRGAAARQTDPLRLACTRPSALPDQPLIVYPRFYSMDEFIVPLGRRYQPGGIPLSSSTGDAVEFIGTRDYRPGDAPKNIHWRSWARRGQPVVKEFQEEYFCRIALILDTFVPRRASAADARGFEAGISYVASVADFFSRSDYIVDILAAGPDIYEVSAGRSLAYLENILDVLACLDPCREPAFATIGPHLFEKLAQITTVVAVLQDWDEERRDFLRRVRVQGAAVRTVIVREGETHISWRDASAEIGEVSRMTPAEVERLIESHAGSLKAARGAA